MSCVDLPLTPEGEFYHVRIKPEEVGNFVIIPGDPDRVPLIASFLSKAKRISEHREFTVYNGRAGKALVTVVSSGIGSPAVAIVLEELVRAGAKTFIRVGTCGAIQRKIDPGDLVVASSAVRMEGTSLQYVPVEYPAVASPDVTLALTHVCRRLGFKHHIGMCASTDSFYVGQGRTGFRGFSTSKSENLVRNLSDANVLCFEMEASALFTVASVYGLKAGAILAVVANRITGKFEIRGIDRAAKTAVEAIEELSSHQTE